jgi:diguanylate cyclase (GGDEF)-like protein
MVLQSESLGAGSVTLGVSIGITHVQYAAEGVEQLLKQADMALYRAKQAGKCRIEVHRQM